MYITQYCDDPNNVKQDQLMVAPGEYPDSIFTDYRRRLRIIDKLLYLDDTFTIALDAGDSFVGTIPQGTTVFWEINKNLLNYVNAIFCLHEIINSYNNNVINSTADVFWKKQNGRFWYRFMCEYRDCVVHHSIRIKRFFPMNGDSKISIDELIEELGWLIQDKQQAKYHNKLSAFQHLVERLEKKMKVIICDGERYCSMKEIVMRTSREITDLYTQILPKIFEDVVCPEINWLLDLIHFEEGVAKYTFVVNTERYDSELEPNFSVERYYRSLLLQFGKNHRVCKTMRDLLESRNYTHFYEGNLDIESFADKWSLPLDKVSKSD